MRPAAVAAALAVVALLPGCTLHSDPESDSVARMAKEHAALAVTGRHFAAPADGAPTLTFHAPLAAQYDKVEIPRDLQAGVANLSLTTLGNHNVAIAGPDVPEVLVLGDEAGSPAEGLTRSLELSAGTYTYYCSVPKHREAGMKGTFTVGDKTSS